ncbi:MAG: glycosyltransferase family 2 protein [Acidobacteria bacterium]|nr:glycosyltransferase family 2 protein [Acidobacteriota bacterium]
MTPGGDVPTRTTPHISVVVPAFNAEATVEEALESLQAQRGVSWEAIVVDDGSTDGTGSVATALSRRDARIRVLTHTDRRNHGVAISRNLGVRASRGAIVAFLDADDVLSPDALARYVAAFRRFGEAGVVYGLAEMAENGGDARTIIGRGVAFVPVRFFEQLCRFNVLATSATAARREVLGDTPFPVGLPFQFEDWACWLQLARRTPFVFVPRTLCRYRKVPQGAMGRIEAAGSVPRFEAAQGRFLRSLIPAATRPERRAIREGLTFRTTAALLCALSSGRRFRARKTAGWLAAAMRIAGSAGIVASAVSRLGDEHRRAKAGIDPPLTAGRWPSEGGA